MAFQKRAKIKFKLFGRPDCCQKTVFDESGEIIKIKSYYVVPLFRFKSYDPIRVAIHEVRHRVQHEYPEIQLFIVEDLPDELKEYLQTEIAKKLTLNEIDAQVFDEIAYPIFIENKDEFLKLLFYGVQFPKES